MRSEFGKNLRISIWGGSHEPAIGVDIQGLPVGAEINMTELKAFMKRRAPGNSPFATKRREPDIPIPVKGLSRSTVTGCTGMEVDCKNPTDTEVTRTKFIDAEGADITNERELWTVTANSVSLEIRNTDTRSGDYKALRSIPRPGHADYTARLRYGASLNMAGGGPFSARMTAPLCIAGGIALQLLRQKGIRIGAHIYSVGDIQDRSFDPVAVDAALLEHLRTKDFPVIDSMTGERMQEKITAARLDCDSVGGVVEGCVLGLPGGIGGAMYDGVESALTPILFGIPAVKGVEFGAGFGAAALKGSENNDPFYYDGDVVRTRTNHHGGILGGITTGMPLITRIAFKPTPSISREQLSVDLDKKENTTLVIKGRHDPCVVVRAVPVVEAALALGILDCIMEVKKNV